jgi:hypothetical protein
VIIDPGLPILGFAVLGLAAGLARRGAVDSRRLVNVFIVYTVALGFGAGLTQREIWPFSAWPLIAGKVPALVTHSRTLAVDAEGSEHEIDYRAWGPLEFDELNAWKGKNFFRLDPESRDRVASYLLGIVERARQRWAAGEPERHFDRYLGPFSAPFFLGHPELWIAGVRVPDKPFVGLRFYKESWNVEERRRDPGKVTRTLVYEYRRP